MSFSSKTKTELCRAPLGRACCQLAEIYGVLLYAAVFSHREIRITTDAPIPEVKQALSQLEHITGLEFVQQEAGFHVVHIQTDQRDIYSLSRTVSQLFFQNDFAVYELSLKKGSLEDIFLELSAHKEKEDEEA